MNTNFIGFTFKSLDSKEPLSNVLLNFDSLIKSYSNVFILFNYQE